MRGPRFNPLQIDEMMHRKGGSIFGGNKTPTSSTNDSPFSFGPTTPKTSTFSRKTSFSSSKSPKKVHQSRNNSPAIPNNLAGSPERRVHTSTQHTDSTPLPPFPLAALQDLESQPRAVRNSFTQILPTSEQLVQNPASGTDPSSMSSIAYSSMLTRPSTGYQSISANGPSANFPAQGIVPSSPSLETITYQHIQETSSKRISTLDYLRKA